MRSESRRRRCARLARTAAAGRCPARATRRALGGGDTALCYTRRSPAGPNPAVAAFGRAEGTMVEEEHLDEMESEMGVDELQEMMDKAGLSDLRAADFEDSEIDEAALEQD